MARRPCLVPNCPRLTTGKSARCAQHTAEHNAARNVRRWWYRDPEYVRNAGLIRNTATVCAICGKPFTPDDPPTADHIESVSMALANLRMPNHSLSNLRAVHRSCNANTGERGRGAG